MVTTHETAKSELLADSALYMQETQEYADQGFRPHYCFHGTDLWTDYDNICHYCEIGAYDPRHHDIDSEEFLSEVENRASEKEREIRLDAKISLIQDLAQDIRTEADLTYFLSTMRFFQEVNKNA